jgi:alanyl-tRNA synthetase
MPQVEQMLSSTQVRQQFIDFFSQRAVHTFVASSPVVPHDDPTLLFANAGMNQYKPIFLGRVAPGSPFDGLKRAVNSQKCIRAGGKHNDLDDVGKDTYHHTFFEMLGNWSFGDYFKAEAIQWAWELLTDIWGIDPERLYATYFEGDKALGLEPDREAYDLWCKFLPPERILPGNTKDNFWEMGDTGPCGPCSEIHYDGRTDDDRAAVSGDKLVNRESPDVIEIWNLVFIQYNRLSATDLEQLPANHVDTGLGFERIVRVLQGKTSNYDTDVFAPLFARIREICDAPAYTGSLTEPVDIAYRVLADHARTLTFAITDGAEPSNDGRGYVLRRILRRAVRYGRQTLGVNGLFLHKLVPTVVESMGDAFPELRSKADHVIAVIKDEEEAFGRTLEHGLKLFDAAAETAQQSKDGPDHLRIAASDAFMLHDTFGFPVDLTQLMAEERGLTVDVAGFERLMEEARERSRAGIGGASKSIGLTPSAVSKLKTLNIKPTDDAQKFEPKNIRARVCAIWNGTDFEEAVIAANTRPDSRYLVVLDKSVFYAEMGGQVADTGRMRVNKGAKTGSEFLIEEVRSAGGYIVHVGRLPKGEIRVGDEVELRLDEPRRLAVESNHTSTHMLNLALRQTLGELIEQRGSLVAPDRLRFDYTHNQPMTPEQAGAIQGGVGEMIDRDLTVDTKQAPLDAAKKILGLRAVFGETYPDPVRVVSIGAVVEDLLADPANPDWKDASIEFCGGTHLGSTGQARAFVILSEEAVSKGVRRVIAVTGDPAQAAISEASRVRSRIEGASTLENKYLVDEIKEIDRELEQAVLPFTARAELRLLAKPLHERAKQAHKAAAGGVRQGAVDAAKSLEAIAGMPVVVGLIPAESDRQALLAAMDTARAHHAECAIMLLSTDLSENKVSIAAAVPKPIIDNGLKSGDWVRAVSAVVGGKGGGRPDAAQGGGTDPSKINDAVEQAINTARERLE